MTSVLSSAASFLPKLDHCAEEPSMTKWMSPSQLPPVRDMYPNKAIKRTRYDWLSVNDSMQLPLRATMEPISDMATASYMKLASGAENIKVWDSSPYVLSCHFSPYASSIRSLHWSPDCLNLVSVPKDGQIVATTYVKSTDVHSFEINTGATNTYARFANTSPQILAIGTDGGTIHIWNMKTQKSKVVFKKHSNEVTCLQFNWNDSYIASGSVKGDIVLHSTLTNQEHMLTSSKHPEAIRGLQYNYVKKSLLGTVYDSGILSLWDVNEMKLLHSFQDSHIGPTSGLAFSPVNNVLIASVGFDKRLVCYDAQLKSLIRTFRTEAPLTSVDFMDDGITLAVGSNKGKIYIYDLRSSCVPIKTLAAHTSSVNCISFQHTAHNLASKASMSSKKVQQQLIKEVFTHDNNLNQQPSTTFGNKDFISNASQGTFEETVCETSDIANNASNSSLKLDSVFSPLGSHEVSESFRRQPIGGGCQASLSSIANSNAVESRMPVSTESIQASSLQKFYSQELKNPISRQEKNIDMQLCDLNIDDTESSTATSRGCISPLSPVQIPRQPEISGAWGDGGLYLSKSEYSTTKDNASNNQYLDHGAVEIGPVTNNDESRMEMDSLGIEESRDLITVSLKEHIKTTKQNTFKNQIKQIIQDSFKEQGQQEIHELLKKCVQQVVDDSVEELHDVLHREHIQLQSEMVRQFQIQLMEIQELLKQTLLNEQQLIAEVERLKIENERLKMAY